MVQQVHALDERDEARRDFETDADLVTGSNPQAMDYTPGSAAKDATAVNEAEARLQEYLLFGPNGSAFSDNPTTAVSGEDRGWTGGVAGIFSDFYHRRRLSEYLWWLYQVGDATARNAVNTYTFFLIGGGSNVSFESEADDVAWGKLSRQVRWKRMERQIVKGACLFGETFAMVEPKKGQTFTDQGGVLVPMETAAREMGSGQARLRVLNTFDIEDIRTAPGDPETVLAYMQRVDADTLIGHEPVDVVHFTLDTMPGNVRGHPILLPVLQPLFFYRSFLSNRHWLNMVRTRIPLILRRKGGGAGAMANLKTKYAKLPAPGTVWTLPGTVEAEFPAHNIGAQDVKADGQQFLRTVAMGIQLPEFLLTADASNANYSSSVVAEAPAMQMFHDIQGILSDLFVGLVARLLGKTDTEGITVTFPALERNMLAVVQGLSIMHGDGVLSSRSYSERAGFQWQGTDGEAARIETEAGFVRPSGPGAPPPAMPRTGNTTPPGLGGAPTEP